MFTHSTCIYTMNRGTVWIIIHVPLLPVENSSRFSLPVNFLFLSQGVTVVPKVRLRQRENGER